MRTITTTAVVNADHTMIVQMPTDIPPGSHEVVIVLNSVSSSRPISAELKLPVHDVGPIDPTCTYRREDMYGDDGR